MQINKALMSGIDIGDRKMSVCGEIENLEEENKKLNEEYVKMMAETRHTEIKIKENINKIKMLRKV
tara:strand:+ start:373 stop:570 length:198 start_codon:yes stop_codon:yes gene_type:complete